MNKRDHLEAETGEIWRTNHEDLVLVLKPVPDPPNEGLSADALVHNITRHGLADIHPTSITGSALQERLRVGADEDGGFIYVREAEHVADLEAYHDAIWALMKDLNSRLDAIREEIEYRGE